MTPMWLLYKSSGVVLLICWGGVAQIMLSVYLTVHLPIIFYWILYRLSLVTLLLTFLDASSRLCMRACPSIRLSICPPVRMSVSWYVRPSVCPLALMQNYKKQPKVAGKHCDCILFHTHLYV